MATTVTRPPLLSERLSSKLQRLIDRGTLRPGDRMPSVRELSREERLSITTVLEAYRRLEDGGHVEARPQSGYFVRVRAFRAPNEPRKTEPPRRATRVTNGELMGMLLQDAMHASRVDLGTALPAKDLIPTEKINRGLARAGRGPSRASFGSPLGAQALRVQVARHALHAGLALTPDEIIITNGCQEALYFALRVTCRPGDVVVMESPTYYGFLQLAEHLGLHVVETPTYPREGLCLDELKDGG